jgi:hypothetical protein
MDPRAGLDTQARGKILCLCRGSNLDRPSHSQTLHWLSYPAHRAFSTSPNTRVILMAETGVQSDGDIRSTYKFLILIHQENETKKAVHALIYTAAHVLASDALTNSSSQELPSLPSYSTDQEFRRKAGPRGHHNAIFCQCQGATCMW